MQFTLAEFFERCAGVQFALIKCFAHCYLEFSLSFFLDSQQTWFICRLPQKAFPGFFDCNKKDLLLQAVLNKIKVTLDRIFLYRSDQGSLVVLDI